MTEQEIFVVSSDQSFHTDLDFEFDAPKYHDFQNSENDVDEQDERWFRMLHLSHENEEPSQAFCLLEDDLMEENKEDPLHMPPIRNPLLIKKKFGNKSESIAGPSNINRKIALSKNLKGISCKLESATIPQYPSSSQIETHKPPPKRDLNVTRRRKEEMENLKTFIQSQQPKSQNITTRVVPQSCVIPDRSQRNKELKEQKELEDLIKSHNEKIKQKRKVISASTSTIPKMDYKKERLMTSNKVKEEWKQKAELKRQEDEIMELLRRHNEKIQQKKKHHQ